MSTKPATPVNFPPSISHTCADRPHLPCTACELPGIDQQSKRIATVAFRLGYRAALLDAMGRNDIYGIRTLETDSHIAKRATELLGPEYKL